MEQKRLYPDMTAEQQLQWVTDFEALMADGGERVVAAARSRQPQWQTGDAQTVRRLVEMLAAWPFAQDFADKAQRYGDYMARAGRIPVYYDKVMERLADGLTMQDQQGRTVAYVSPSAPLRRRGRPSMEELAARLRGEHPAAGAPDDAETRKRRTIARMMGLEVVVSGEPPREKNNAELAADRAARKAEYDRQNPSLFGDGNNSGSLPAAGGAPVASAPGASGTETAARPADGGSLACPTMSEIYAGRIEQDRLRLSDLAWLCSDELRERIPTVQALRVTAESASERAKTMAELGQPADAIAPYAQQAKDAVEAYQAIYAAVDEELAVQFKRLSLDLPYIDRFRQRFRGVDIEKVLHICRPYYEKVKKEDPAIDARVKSAIEQDDPGYAAKMKAEEEKKQELQALHRYIMRTDKPASDERVKTMTGRIARVRQLAGDEAADAYLPVLEKTKADNLAWRAAKDADSAAPKEQKKSSKAPAKPADKAPKPSRQKPKTK